MIKLIKNKKLSAKRGISSIVGTLLMVAVVAAIGSVLLFQGMNNINNFNFTLSYLTGSKDSLSENITIEHVRFNPTTNHLNIYLRNTGLQQVEIDKITMVKLDTQELILNNNTNTVILSSVQNDPKFDFKNMTQLSTLDSLLTYTPSCSTPCWNHNYYNSTDYKISIITTTGNSFETTVRPFNS